MIILDVKK